MCLCRACWHLPGCAGNPSTRFATSLSPIILSALNRRLHHALVRGVVEPEAELLAHALHGGVVRQDVGHDAAEPFLPPDVDKAAQNLGAESALLKNVRDQTREL